MSKQNVLPLPYFDDTPLWRAFILYYMFVFDSVLDPEKLKSSLELLASREGWKKLGARIRQGENGNLEYHFPEATGTNEHCQIISYNHVVYDITAAQHPTACRIPEPATGGPSVVGDPDRLEDLFRQDGAPTKMGDYIQRDIPQLGLHIVSFLDKTIVTVYFPHTLMDGMSMAPFLDAWILALQGRASEIKRPIGAERYGQECSNDDPLGEFGMKPNVRHVLASHRMSIVGLVAWMLRNVGSFFTSLENRMVCVPASTMDMLHKETILDSAGDRVGDQPSPFLSDGDVLCAWWTRLLLATAGVPQTTDKTVVLNSAYSLRKLLDSHVDSNGVQKSELAQGHSNVYVSNLVAFFNVILTAVDILQKPLYCTALSIRRALDTQRTRPQAEAFLYMWRNSWGKMPPMFGTWKMDLITFSNWTRAKLFDIDFSAASVEAADAERAVKPLYVQNNQFGLKLPNAFPIMGRDGSGNYWLSGYLKRGHWGRIEAQLGVHSSPPDTQSCMEQ